MKLAAAFAACCLGICAAEGDTAEAVSLRGHHSVEGDPFNTDAAQRLLASFPGMEGFGAAGTAVQQLLLTGQAKPASLAGLAGQISRMVYKMTTEVTMSHHNNKGDLNKAIKLFEKCRGPRWRLSGGVSTKGIRKLRRKADKANKKLNKCRASAAAFGKMVTSCKAEVAALRDARDAMCKDYHETNTLFPKASDACTVAEAGETQHQWVKRMKRYVKHETKTIEKHRRVCKKGERQLKGPERLCKMKQKALKGIKHRCNVVLTAKLTESTCAYQTGLESMCASYHTCYKTQVKMYKKLTNRTAGEVITRKLQWRMLKRLECLVNAYDFKSSKINKGKLDACVKSSVYGTDHLDIVPPSVPERVGCSTRLPPHLAMVGGQSCTPTTTTTTTTQRPESYWSKCFKNSPFPVRRCKAGYTQKGQKVVDANWERNRRECCRSTSPDTGMCKKHGSQVKCVDADNPSDYLSGQCTGLAMLGQQCPGGRVIRQTKCKYFFNGGLHHGYQCSCKMSR